ncbi:hypothetical protein [Pseudomonas coronafaciens]|nr:hypothetical protein [Pseudomonas coronafaciens]
MQEIVTAKGFAAAERAEKRTGLSEFLHASFLKRAEDSVAGKYPAISEHP